jgi:hypothetical protein
MQFFKFSSFAILLLFLTSISMLVEAKEQKEGENASIEKCKGHLLFTIDTSSIVGAIGSYTVAVVFLPDQSIKSAQGIIGGLPVNITIEKALAGEYLTFLIVDHISIGPFGATGHPILSVFNSRTGITTVSDIGPDKPIVGSQDARAYINLCK